MTARLADVIAAGYRPHDRRIENQLIGSGGLTAVEIAQAFYGVVGGREFLVNFLAEHARPVERTPAVQQTWERPVMPGTDPRRDPVAARLHLEVDDEGRVRVHEAVLAQLLTDAGWERTA